MSRIISVLIFVLLTIGTTNVVFAQADEQSGMDAAAMEARIEFKRSEFSRGLCSQSSVNYGSPIA